MNVTYLRWQLFIFILSINNCSHKCRISDFWRLLLNRKQIHAFQNIKYLFHHLYILLTFYKFFYYLNNLVPVGISIHVVSFIYVNLQIYFQSILLLSNFFFQSLLLYAILFKSKHFKILALQIHAILPLSFFNFNLPFTFKFFNSS